MVLASLLSVTKSLGYPLLGILVAVEALGVPVPGETAVIFAGLAANSGRLSIVLVIVVASAGNANTNAPQFPASANHVLGVAATDLSDKKASFSNYGSDVFVDAPGVNIISAYPGGYYAIASGTSFSAPFVSAEAALLHSASWKNSDNAISSGTVNIDAENPGYRNQLGSGRIDMFKALQSQK